MVEKLLAHLRGNAVAYLALFLALGGTVYAANSISGKNIRKSSLPGNRIKPDTVTGTQVNESSLGQVPSAKSATSAESAGSAHDSALLNGKTASDLTGASGYVFSNDPCSPGCPIFENRGLSSATRTSMGIYCVVAAGFDGGTTAAVVSVEVDGTPNAGDAEATNNEDSQCGPNLTGFVVETWRHANNSGALAPATLANDVSFTIVIPR
jgi:hypothetical protein